MPELLRGSSLEIKCNIVLKIFFCACRDKNKPQVKIRVDSFEFLVAQQLYRPVRVVFFLYFQLGSRGSTGSRGSILSW